MNVYVLFLTADIEMLLIEVMTDEEKANHKFDALMKEHRLDELTNENWEDWQDNELDGTLRIAGDDSCCVQLVKRELLN